LVLLSTPTARAQRSDGTPCSNGKCGASRPIRPDSLVVALLPFSVRGPAALSYLDSGMVDLFQTAIEGAGKFRVLNPTTAAAQLRQAGSPRTSATAAPVTTALGARWIVAGSIVATGDELQINAELYDAVAKRRVMPLVGRAELPMLGRIVDSLAWVMTRTRGSVSVDKANWGTLVAAGQLEANQTILVTDFTAQSADSGLARMATDLLRMGLSQSQLFRVMAPATVAGALQRMRREPRERVTLAIAREISQREHVSVIVDGALSATPTGLLVTASVVSVESRSTLAFASATATGSADLIDAMDDVSRRLRSKIGESLKNVRAAPRLAQVTTSSYQALEKYTAGARAFDVERDFPKAVTLLKDAVALDSTFAMAWRKLGVAYAQGNLGAPQTINDALRRALMYGEKLTDDERLITAATYYSAIGERGKSIAAYEELFRRRPDPADSSGFNNLADALLSRREYARSEAFSRAFITRHPDSGLQYGSLADALLEQNKVREADSVATVAVRRFPVQHGMLRARMTCRIGAPSDCDRMLDSLHTSGTVPQRIDAATAMVDRALQRGHLALANQLQREWLALDSARGGQSRAGPREVWIADGIDAWVRGKPELVGPRLDSLRASLPPFDTRNGPFFLTELARHYAWGGRPDSARSMLAQLRALRPDSTLSAGTMARKREGEAEIARAERRWQDALVAFKATEFLPDGPRRVDIGYDLGIVYEGASQPDSAVALYEQTLSGPNSRPFDMIVPNTHERLCRLHSDARRLDKAVLHCGKFVELWKDADAELQPRVEAARLLLRRAQTLPDMQRDRQR
jgi:tetratricopeptide (TPR) repeat protein/TolB-like protein